VNHLSAIDHGFALWKCTRYLKRQYPHRFYLKEEVRDHIKRLAPTKAPGMDKIDGKIAKSLPNSVIAHFGFPKPSSSCYTFCHLRR